MKDDRHKRRESYSVLVVSNLSRESRQFQIVRSRLHLLVWLAVFVCIAVGGLVYWAVMSGKKTAELQKKISEQEEQALAWEKEKEELNSKNKELEEELSALTQELSQEQSKAQEAAEAAAEAAEAEEGPALPELYPYSGVGTLASNYSEEQPYISISTYNGGNVIAAGNGTVAAVLSNDVYKYIIEIEHEGGYETRYFYSEDADLKVEEGTQVKGGDILLTVAADGVDLDYQVLYNGETIDPFSVIDAEG